MLGALYEGYEHSDWLMNDRSDIRLRITSMWEVWEIFRKLLLTSVIIFVAEGSAGQCKYYFELNVSV